VIRTLSDPANAGGLAFSPRNSNVMAVAGRTGIDLWQLATRTVRTYQAPDAQGAVSVSYAPDGAAVAESSSAGGVYVLNPATGKWVTRLAGEAGDAGGPVMFSPDGKTIAVADTSGRVRVQPAAGGAAAVFPGAVTGAKTQSVAFSPDGKTLAFATASGGVQVRSVTSGKVTAQFSGSGAQAVAFSPDGAALAAGEAGGAVDFWDLATRSELSVSLPAGAGGAVTSLAFSPDAKTLAVASSGDRIYLFNVKYIAS
jgi:WD40 repeat protein